MAVRFTPSDPVKTSVLDRSNLAEVIDLRSRLLYQGETQQPAVTRQAKILELKTALETPKLGVDKTATNSAGEDPVDSDAAQQEVLSTAKKALAKKQLSLAELEKTLTAKEFDPGLIATVIAEFETRNYLNDTDLAKRLCEKLRSQKGYSRAQISQKLRARLLPPAVIAEVTEQLDQQDETELLLKAASDRAAKLKQLDYQTAERRLLSYLARRGWSGQQVYETVKQALAEAGITTSGETRGSSRVKTTGSSRAKANGRTPRFR